MTIREDNDKQFIESFPEKRESIRQMMNSVSDFPDIYKNQLINPTFTNDRGAILTKFGGYMKKMEDVLEMATKVDGRLFIQIGTHVWRAQEFLQSVDNNVLDEMTIQDRSEGYLRVSQQSLTLREDYVMQWEHRLADISLVISNHQTNLEMELFRRVLRKKLPRRFFDAQQRSREGGGVFFRSPR